MINSVWYVIRDDVYIVWGALLALYISLTILLILFGGIPTDWWRPSGWKRDY